MDGEGQGNGLRGDVLGDVLEDVNVKELADVIARQIFDPGIHNQLVIAGASTAAAA